MKPPCVIIVYYVLPAIRALVARELVDKYHMRQIDAAARMGVAPAALTQYSKGRRGSSFVETLLNSEKAVKAISNLVACLENEETSIDVVMHKTCEACSVIRSEGLTCELHEEELQALKGCKCDFCEDFTC